MDGVDGTTEEDIESASIGRGVLGEDIADRAGGERGEEAADRGGVEAAYVDDRELGGVGDRPLERALPE